MNENDNGVLKYLKLFGDEVRILYNGPIEGKLLSSIGAYLRAILKNNPKVGRKLLAVYVELVQNTAYYSASRCILESGKEVGVGVLSISEFDDKYIFSTGNKIKNEGIFSMLDKCEYINSLNRENLRKYKRKQRKLPFGEKGNAHIGLIQVALISSNPITLNINPDKDDFSFLSVTVKINK